MSGARGWLFFSKMVVHVQFGVYGAAVMATLLFLVPRSSLSALIRIPIFAAFFVWWIWIIVWVLVRRAFGIELTTDIVWELFTNRAAIAAVGLGENEFVLGTTILLTIGVLLGLASDRISQHTNKILLRRGCVICVAAFALIHLPLRFYALSHASSNGQPIVVYHDYVPALLRVERSSSNSNGDIPVLPNLESRARTAAYFDQRRLERLPVIPQPRNIVWINLESFRFDVIEPGAMPHLAAYADHFQIKLDRQHWSNGNATQFGIFSQLSGLSGFHLHNLSRAKVPDPFLLLLAQNGYRLRVAKKNQLNYIGLSVLLPPGTVEHDVEAKSKDDEDRTMTDAYLRDCAARQSGTRTFDFIAFDATHWPYAFPPAHSVFQPDPPLSGSQMILGFAGELSTARNRYRNACHFVDEQIDRILDDLRARGEFDSTIIVILGDHGEEFRERGQVTHTGVLNDFQARTALWLHLPGIGSEPLPINVPTTHMDIVPTILQTLGFSEDVLYTQGRSLLSELEYRSILSLSDTGFSVPLYRALVTDTYISRWSLRPLQYRFAGVRRRDGGRVEGEDWLREVREWNSEAAAMYELLPDVTAPARKFTPRPTR